MSYCRIYPNKNTTIFKRGQGSQAEVAGTINTGKNPTFELTDGNTQSAILMQFDIDSIKTTLQNNTYTCNLQLWDAGQVFEPSISLKTIDLLYFKEDFTEGDGWFFFGTDAKLEAANWIYRNTGVPWSPAQPDTFTQGTYPVYQLNEANEDLKITDLQSFVTDAITNNVNPNFGIRISPEVLAQGTLELLTGSSSDVISEILVNNVNILGGSVTFNTNLATTILDLINNINDTASVPNYTASVDPLNNNKLIIKPLKGTGAGVNGFVVNIVASGFTFTSTNLLGGITGSVITGDQTFTKFIHSRHTRTIFKPYLEFFIDDNVIDQTYNTYASQPTTLYLINQRKQNFSDTVTATITDSDGNTLDTPSVTNSGNGVYHITFTPDITTVNTEIFINWIIGTEQVSKNIVSVKSFDLLQEIDVTGLYFFPTNDYTHSYIRLNDKVKFNLTAQIRGNKGCVVNSNYEYRVVSSSQFEMIPWQPVNIYNNNMYFYIDTSYFFSDLEYEVFVRFKDNNITKTSNITYKFRLQDDTASHLRNKSASPYNDRDSNFKK